MKTATKDSELLCSSSEAFALLLLENHWERWIDLYIISKGEIFQRGKSVLGDYETDIPPKYTRGGSKTVRGIGKGWTKEGIERFNELYLTVKNDRQKHPKFIRGWLDQYSNNDDDKQAKVESEGGNHQGAAFWTLGDDEDDGIPDSIDAGANPDAPDDAGVLNEEEEEEEEAEEEVRDEEEEEVDQGDDDENGEGEAGDNEDEAVEEDDGENQDEEEEEVAVTKKSNKKKGTTTTKQQVTKAKIRGKAKATGPRTSKRTK